MGFFSRVILPWALSLGANVYLPGLVIWLLSRHVIKAPKIATVVEIIVSFVTMQCILPVIVSILLVNLIVRSIVNTFLTFRYRSKIWLMSGRDSFVSHDEFANSCNHYSLYVMKGKCDLNKIRKKFQSILEQRWTDGEFVYDRMKRRLVKKCGFYCWEHMGQEFRINDHVKFLNEEEEELAEKPMGEEDVFRKLEKLYDFPLPGDKPQWEILVIPKYIYKDDNNNGSGEETPYYAFIVRMHHCIMDGISAGNALQHYMADKKLELTVDPLSKTHQLSVLQTVVAYLQVILLGPHSFFKVMALKEENDFHGPQLTGPKYLGWSRQVNVQALKQIKEWSQTTVTAVLISALGGSVRSLALKRNLRVPEAVHGFPTIGILPFKDIRPRNQFTMALLPLRIGLTTELERLKSAHTSLKNLLTSPDVLTNYHLMSIIGSLPVPVINFFVDMCHATMLLSNVPGPAESGTMFGGDEIVDIGIWAPIQLAMGIGMSLFSYGGRVRATVVVDHTSCPDPSNVDTILNGFQKEIMNLAEQANVNPESLFLKPH